MISDLHPDRTKSGIFAHFKDRSGAEHKLESTAHQNEQIRMAAGNAFELLKEETVFGTEELIKINPKWIRHFGLPMIQISVFKASNEAT